METREQLPPVPEQSSPITTISATTCPTEAVLHAVMGGKFRIHLIPEQDGGDSRPGHRYGSVLDDAGNVIGDAYDSTYGGAMFTVHTRPFAGCVYLEQIVFV